MLNERTGEVVYTPPQNHAQIIELMTNLEKFINDDELCSFDPLITMALIHHQFESIHPFYERNGRTGRIINILYLIKEDLLKIPVLYLSRYIISHKHDYYRLLQQVHNNNYWEPRLLFMLEAVAVTAAENINTTIAIREAIQQYKENIRSNLPKIYSQDLLNNLFSHPYTKIEYIMNDLQVSRGTAVKYLKELVKLILLMKQKIGRDSYYVNKSLFDVLIRNNS